MRFLRRLLVTAVAVSSTLFGYGLPPSTAAVALVYTPPAAIAADCSADVSAALQAFFDSIPDQAVVRLAAHACYRVEREVAIPNKHGWTLDGQGATLRRTQLTPPERMYPHANAMLRFNNLSDSTISRLNIVGINTLSDKVALRPAFGAWISLFAFDHGLALGGAVNVSVRDITVDAMYGDGVYVGGSDDNPQSRNVTLTNVTVDRNGRQGVAITSANGVLLDGVVIAHSRQAGIDMEPHPGQTVENVEIRGSRLSSWLLAITGGGVGVVRNVNIHDNTILRSALPLVHDRDSGAEHGRRSGWRVTHNTVAFNVRSSAAAMSFGNTEDVLVEANVVPFSGGAGLVASLTDTSHALVRCNVLPGASLALVRADATSTFVAESNALATTALWCSAT